MRKKSIHLLGLIEFLILFATLLFFVLSSEKSMIYLANKATEKFNINYSSLEGNLLKNITLFDMSYKGRVLAQKAHVDINFKALLKAELKLDDITLQKVDLSVLEQLIKDQNLQKKNSDGKKLKNIPTITISNIFFSTKPYLKDDIKIDEFKFNANDVKGDFTNLDIGSFSLYSKNDYTDITADGQIKNKVLDFNHLWIADMDLDKILKFYNTKIKKQDSNTTLVKKEKGLSNLVKIIKINNFKTNIKPYNYKKYSIKELKIKADGISSDLASYEVKQTSIASKTNMWEFSSKGHIKDNKFFADVIVKLNDSYFKKFIPFFDHDKIKPIALSLEIDKDGLSSDIQLSSSNLLTGKSKDLNLTVKNALCHVDFRFKPPLVNVQIDGNLTTKYSKDISFKSNLLFDKKFSYDGTLIIDELQNLDSNFTKLMKDSKIVFNGNTKNIQATLKNKNLSADYSGKNYKNTLLKLETKELKINNYLANLPPQLSNLQASLKAKVPIDFNNLKEFNSDISLISNMVNLDGKLSFFEGFRLDSTITLSPNSILKNFDKNLKLKALFPIYAKTNYKADFLESKFENKLFDANLRYEKTKKEFDALLNIQNDQFSLKGSIDDKLIFKTQTLSLKTLQEKASKFYNFTKQPLDGEVSLQATITPANATKFQLDSRWLVYEYKPNKFAFAEKIKLNFDKKDDIYELQNYYFSTYLDYDRVFYASKPSQILYKNSKAAIKELWINDQATLKGSYDINKSLGQFTLNADNYHYKGVEGDIFFKASLKSALAKDGIKIDGKVEVLKGEVNYEAKKEHYIQDDDIIIIQEQREDDHSKKDNNISIDISLITKNPITYNIEDTKAVVDLDLQLWKRKQEKVELLGVAKILEGMHFEGEKKFTVQSSEVFFAGEVFNPFLNISLTHQSDPYNISINISGLLDSPNINFSSTPFLTQSDILSILLFNSTTADLTSSDTDSSKAALSMFGNTFAKELVENFGIKLDKLVLSTNEEGGFGLEVGKKISRKITILYINDIVQTIKVKYQHSKKFETDITLSPDTRGIDFLYKNQY